MRRIAGVVALVMFALGASGSAAQSRPNFSGTWTLVAPESSNAAGIAFLGLAFTAEQTEKTLTVTPTSHQIHRGEKPEQLRAVYRLDGSEDTNPYDIHAAHGGGTAVRLSTAKWDANKMVLVITLRTNGFNGSTHVQAWSLDPSGNLIVEATVTARGETVTYRATYTKDVNTR